MSSADTSICAVLLAGGKSIRMGRNKAFLKLYDRSFIDILLEKLCLLDIDEILISGEPDVFESDAANKQRNKQVRVIPDVIRDKGPLGGLYSCFQNTECNSALVISTDIPLITTDTLNSLIMHHNETKRDATVLTAASHTEPLIAVYETDTLSVIKYLIDNDNLYMRSLLDCIDTCYLEFTKDPSELYNCNTQEDYRLLLSRY